MNRSFFCATLVCFSVLGLGCDTEPLRVVSAKIVTTSGEVKDAIKPSEIEHKVDEIVVDGRVNQKYEYLDYHFEKYGAYMRARAYFHRPDRSQVSVYGPFRSRAGVGSRVDAPKLFAEVFAYLKRRFAAIQVLDGQGYKTIWRQPAVGRSE